MFLFLKCVNNNNLKFEVSEVLGQLKQVLQNYKTKLSRRKSGTVKLCVVSCHRLSPPILTTKKSQLSVGITIT